MPVFILLCFAMLLGGVFSGEAEVWWLAGWVRLFQLLSALGKTLGADGIEKGALKGHVSMSIHTQMDGS